MELQKNTPANLAMVIMRQNQLLISFLRSLHVPVTVDSSQPFYFSTHAKVEGIEVREPFKSPVFHFRFYPRAQRSNNNTRKYRTESGQLFPGSVTGTNCAVCTYRNFCPVGRDEIQKTKSNWWNINLYGYRLRKQPSFFALGQSGVWREGRGPVLLCLPTEICFLI